MKVRSECPINLSIEILGDQWSLIILRDMIFGGRRSYRELLTNSLEGIASNILASRMKMLLDEGMVTRAPDPEHKQRVIYSLTEKSISVLPVLVQLGAWGRRFLPASPELSIRAQVLEEGGPEMLDAFMRELRTTHLGAPNETSGPTVAEQLQAAYEEAVRQQGDRG
jgi:DNA-binding HxlR family transcriptional regulator